MNERERTKLSKLLSLVLRHRPELMGIELDRQGWVPIGSLVDQCRRHGHPVSVGVLREVVEADAKRRFAISEDGLKIRASQGHSVSVDLGYEPAQPPSLLFHGTVARKLDAIRENGLDRSGRHHVHLSTEREMAHNVGRRRGHPVVLVVRAGEMASRGYSFFLSANGVWLTERVPVEYIDFPGGADPR